MTVYAVNILGRSSEPLGRAEMMVAGDEQVLRREFSAFFTAASAVLITTELTLVRAELAASGWAPPAITEGDRPRLYRCDPLPEPERRVTVG